MAIVLVKIENKDSLPLNEFFDYNGSCYGITKARDSKSEDCIDFADFFEASVSTQSLENVAVVFAEENGEILGFYRRAVIYKKAMEPNIFLEGNIVARAEDAVLLPTGGKKYQVTWNNRSSSYEVVEKEDDRFQALDTLVQGYSGENAFLRYPFVEAKMIPSATKSIEACNEACEFYAGRILNNSSSGIVEMKLLESYGKKLTEMAPKSADGYYYLAMAQCQLGFCKKAIKAIEKAIKLEPEASDLIAQKAIILCGMGHNLAAADGFLEAFRLSHDEQYLLMQGQAYFRNGDIDKGYQCYKSIQDQTILEEAGIELNYMEKKWSFSSWGKSFLRGINK